MKKIFSIIILFILITAAYSQPQEVWIRKFVYNSICTVNDMCLDKSGNVYLAGHTDSPDSLLIIKYKTSGDVLWSKTYGGYSHQEYPNINIAVDDSGNSYVMCPVNIYYYQGQGFRTGTSVLKYSSVGELLWENKFMCPDTLECVPIKMIIDSHSNIYVIARAWGGEAQSSNWVTLKYNSIGTLMWSRYYDNPFHTFDTPQFISKDKDDNIYVCGWNLSTNPVTIKYNPLGDSLWVRMDSIANGKMIIDDSYNIYYGGGQTIGLVGYIKTCKVNLSGKILWNRIYKNPNIYNGEQFRDFCLDKNGNIYTVGASLATDKIRLDYVTIKYDSNGDSLWVRRYSPQLYSNDNPVSVTLDKFGNIIVTGSIKVLFEKYATVVYSPTGVQRYVLQYTNSPSSATIPIKVLTDTSGNIYVTGGSQEINGIATLKYSSVTGVSQISENIPDRFSLEQNYPNPFNPTTKINFSIPKADFVSIVVYDELGRTVKELLKESKGPGSYSITFDGSSFSSGIYFYRIETKDFSETKRMVLVK